MVWTISHSSYLKKSGFGRDEKQNDQMTLFLFHVETKLVKKNAIQEQPNTFHIRIKKHWNLLLMRAYNKKKNY